MKTSEELTTIIRFGDIMSAQVCKSKLESLGFQVYLSNEYFAQLYPVNIAEIELQVPEIESERAIEMLKELSYLS